MYSGIASFSGAMQQSGVLAAFVGSEVRGVARPGSIPIPFPPLKGKRAFEMMVYGDSPGELASLGEMLSFEFWDGNRTFLLAEQLRFEADAVIGNAQAPFSFEAASAAIR